MQSTAIASMGAIRANSFIALAFTFGILFGSGAEALTPTPIDVSADLLPPLSDQETNVNPYRGNPDVLETGRLAYAQACAKCHGEDAIRPGPAADLKLVGRYCGRVEAPDLKARCIEDADYYYLKTLREGKVRLGVRHMPAWGDSMDKRLAWAIQAFIESARSAPRPIPQLSPR